MPVMAPMSGQPKSQKTPQSEKLQLQQQLVPQQSHLIVSPEPEDQHDYVNCIPPTTKIVTPKAITPGQQQKRTNSVANTPSVADDLTGDYAVMNPLKTVSSPVSQSVSSPLPQPPTTKKSLLLTITSQEKLNNVGFKPIVEDEGIQKHSFLTRQVSEKRSLPNENSGYEILRPCLSRPNSVNSEKISNKSNTNTAFNANRPSSANSERLASVSSTSSSTSTLCDTRSQSSSSTIRLMDTSNIPSPMNQTSRPESVSSDTHMGCSRPPSVSSERGLHYASLDLPPTSNATSTVTRMEVDEVKT
jgi:hypothetical protein